MLSRCLLLGLLLIASSLLTACPSPAQQTAGPNKERVVATVGNEPIYAVQIDRMLTEAIKRIRNEDGIFARPSPEEIALMREAFLHELLLDSVYKQPDMTFSKNRARDYTREATLAKAREVREALLNGASTDDVVRDHIVGIYKEPAQVKVDLLSNGQIQPAYKAEVFSTPVGEITDIIEDPSGGYYILRIVNKELLEGDIERVQADSFFIPWDKDAGRRRVKEEDLAQSRVAVVDPTLQALTALREARDAGEAKDTVKEQEHLASAKAALEAARKSWEKTPEGQFLFGWITELQARDPSTGATYEQALAAYQQAADMQAKAAPGDSEYGYYLARVGEMQERIGDTAKALESYKASLEAAKDNLDLTLNLRAHFEQLNDTESLKKADAEIERMGRASTYGQVVAGQKVLRTPGRMAEGVTGDSQIFEIESTSQVVE